MVTKVAYELRGVLLSSCNCDWGCPCNFEAPPTYGNCEGIYAWHFQDAVYGGVRLDGLTVVSCASAPGPLHEGNITALLLIDERADNRQRAAVEDMFSADADIMPFAAFIALTSNDLGVRHVPIYLSVDGIHSSIKIPEVLDLQLTPMKNPVTGEDELATLLKPTGFTAQQSELCATSVYWLAAGEGLTHDHSGKYGEFCPFEYKSS